MAERGDSDERGGVGNWGKRRELLEGWRTEFGGRG